MISKDWATFNKYVTLKDKDISIYEDEEGNYAVLPTANLLCGVQYNELTQEQLNVAIFEKKIPKDMKLKTIEKNKIISKKEKTGKEEDKNILIESDEKEKRYKVWFIIDGMKNITAFNNPLDAIMKAKKKNEEIFNLIK